MAKEEASNLVHLLVCTGRWSGVGTQDVASSSHDLHHDLVLPQDPPGILKGDKGPCPLFLGLQKGVRWVVLVDLAQFGQHIAFLDVL